MNRTRETSPPFSSQQTRAWHTLSTDEVLAALETSPEGLSSEEAQRRLQQYGVNELTAGEHVSPWRILLSQFQNVLILILLVATGRSGLVGHGSEVIAIAVIVMFALLLGFIQEYRAERAIEALREMAAPLAKVMRGGREKQIAAREMVPGDIVLLHAGDKVPA